MKFRIAIILLFTNFVINAQNELKTEMVKVKTEKKCRFE